MANQVTYDTNMLTRDLAGKTVGEVRRMMSDQLNIPGSAMARVNGVDANDSMVLTAEDSVLFLKAMGEKGTA